jgi:hypothetical protein
MVGLILVFKGLYPFSIVQKKCRGIFCRLQLVLQIRQHRGKGSVRLKRRHRLYHIFVILLTRNFTEHCIMHLIRLRAVQTSVKEESHS